MEGSMQDMIIGGIAARTDLLVQIAHFQVEQPVPAIAENKIGPILIEEFSIEKERTADIGDNFVLNGSKESLSESRGLRWRGSFDSAGILPR